MFNTSAGATVRFTNDYAIANGSALTGAGDYHLTGGTLSVSGTITLGKFHQTGGRLAGTQTFASGSTFNWSGGDWNTTAVGPLTTIASGATLNLTGGYRDFDYRAIVNNGTVNWSSGYLRSGHGGSFTNAAGATFNDLNVSGYSINDDYGGGFTFTNRGTYQRNVGGATYLDTTFDNHGTVTIQQGDFYLRGGGTNSATGIFNTSAGASVRFTTDYAIANGSALTGAGDYHLSGGTLSVSGAITLGTFHQTAGRLAGTQTFASGSTFNWSGGDWNASAAGSTTTIASGATLNLTGSYRDFDYRAIVNHGTVTWQSGYLRGGNGSTFTNATGGVFNDQNVSGYSAHNAFGGTFSFVNDGRYNKTTSGTTVFSMPFTNNGTLAVSAGTLRFDSTFTNNGALALAGGATLQSSGAIALGTSTLSGTGTITASSVTAGGLVSPGNSAGTLTLTGNLTLLGTSTLLFELGGGTAGTGYDVLLVGGNATLAGNLSLQFLNGYQASVTPGDTFTVFTASGASGLTGSFANIANGQHLLTADGAGLFRVNYGTGSAFAANSIVLSNFVAVPEPSTYALLGLGALVILWQVRRRKQS